MPASAVAVILAAAARVTKRIRLGSSVTVLSTDDPVRVYQQFATLDALSNGRAEITAARCSTRRVMGVERFRSAQPPFFRTAVSFP